MISRPTIEAKKELEIHSSQKIGQRRFANLVPEGRRRAWLAKPMRQEKGRNGIRPGITAYSEGP